MPLKPLKVLYHVTEWLCTLEKRMNLDREIIWDSWEKPEERELITKVPPSVRLQSVTPCHVVMGSRGHSGSPAGSEDRQEALAKIMGNLWAYPTL